MEQNKIGAPAVDATELDKLATYDPDRDSPGLMEWRDRYNDGDYVKLEDVRALVAQQAARIEELQQESAVSGDLLRALDRLRVLLQMATPSIDKIHEFGPDSKLEEAWQIYYDEVMPALNRAAEGVATSERKPLTDDEIKRALLDPRVRSTLFQAAAHAVWQRATPFDEIFAVDAVEAICALKPVPVEQRITGAAMTNKTERPDERSAP